MPDAVRRQLGAEAYVPENPRGLDQICNWWRELSAGRAAGGMTIAALTWLDLQAWSHMTGAIPSPIEQLLILGLDAAFRAEVVRLDGMNRQKPNGRKR